MRDDRDQNGDPNEVAGVNVYVYVYVRLFANTTSHSIVYYMDLSLSI